jgi:hypothetical protein
MELLQRLIGQQPGPILVAAVLIPNDAYPNTTFRGAISSSSSIRSSSPNVSFLATPIHPTRDSTGIPNHGILLVAIAILPIIWTT